MKSNMYLLFMLFILVTNTIAVISDSSNSDSQLEYYVLGQLGINEEKNIISMIAGANVKDFYMDNILKLRKYLLDNNIVVNTDGYGMFWFTGYKKYKEYRNVSMDTVKQVAAKLNNILKKECGDICEVRIIGISELGKRIFFGVKHYKKNNTVAEIPFEVKTVYSVRVDLEFTINNIALQVNPYLVIDFEGQVIGGGFIVPRIIDKGITIVPRREVVAEKITSYLEEKHGHATIQMMSNLSYVYISPRLHGTDKPLLVPGYYVVAVYPTGVAHLYYVRINNEDKIFEAVSNTAWNPPMGVLPSNEPDGTSNVESVNMLNVVLYSLTLIAGILILIYTWKTRHIIREDKIQT